jgi:poly-gamma-glutamate biosynthesis protein PgsC/CapC
MIQLVLDYVFDAELVRLAIFLSAVISVLVYERWGLTTGGTIVAGYLALFVTRPTHILITILIATITFLFVHRVLRPRWMLWGRRLFEVEIVVALVLQSAWFITLALLSQYHVEVSFLYGIGFLLPGIMAHDMGRQGAWLTVRLVVLSALAIFVMLMIVGVVRDFLGAGDITQGGITESVGTLAYPVNWLVIGVVFSVVINIWLYHRMNASGDAADDSIRTGGFVTAAYLALFLTKPIDLVVILLCSVVTYLLVVHVFMKQAILFGRSKLVTMFLTAIIVTSGAELLIVAVTGGFVPFVGFNAIIPTIVALLANDAQRQGVRQTVVGAGAATLGVFAAMLALLTIIPV